METKHWEHRWAEGRKWKRDKRGQNCKKIKQNRILEIQNPNHPQVRKTLLASWLSLTSWLLSRPRNHDLSAMENTSAREQTLTQHQRPPLSECSSVHSCFTSFSIALPLCRLSLVHQWVLSFQLFRLFPPLPRVSNQRENASSFPVTGNQSLHGWCHFPCSHYTVHSLFTSEWSVNAKKLSVASLNKTFKSK